MRRMYANPNRRFRTLSTESVRSIEALRERLAPLQLYRAEREANERVAEAEAAEADRQRKAHALKDIESAKRIRAQDDRRHRPRKVKKASAKRVRKLGLTARLKTKKTKLHRKPAR